MRLATQPPSSPAQDPIRSQTPDMGVAPSLESLSCDRLTSVLLGLVALHLVTVAIEFPKLTDLASNLWSPLGRTSWPAISASLVAFITTIFLLTLRLLLPRLPKRWAEPLAALVAALLVLNCLCWFSARQGAEWLIPLTLTMVCSSMLIFSRAWLALVMIVGATGYLLAGLITGFHAQWLLHSVLVIAAIIISFGLQVLQRRTLRQLLALDSGLATRMMYSPELSPAEAEERFDLWYASTSEGVAVHDKGVILKVNDTLAQWLGSAPEELQGRNLLDWFTRSSRNLVADSILLGNFRPFEAIVRRADKSELPLELFSKALPLHGRMLVVTSFRDVLARRRESEQTQAELQRLEDDYRRQSALAEIGFGGDQADDVRNLLAQVVRAAKCHMPAGGAACLLLEGDKLVLTVQDLGEELLRAGFRPEAQMLRAAQWVQGNRRPLVEPHLQADEPFKANKPLPALGAFAAQPLLDGEVVLGVLFAFDIHGRDYQPEELDYLASLARRASTLLSKSSLYRRLCDANLRLEEQNEKLGARNQELIQTTTVAESVSRAKSAFLATVSHELRTPLNGILGMTSALNYTQLDGEQRECVEALQASAQKLLGSINQILAFADLEAPAADPKETTFDVRNLVSQTLRDHEAQATTKPIKFHKMLTESLPSEVHGNPDSLRQILSHLLDNAVKYTEKGDIAVGATRHSEHNGHLFLRFTVSDTGTGIAPEQQGQIFQTFSRVDDLAARRQSGLGLAICKQMIDRLGGDIGMESMPGQGSTFWFVLPFQRTVAG